MQGLSSFLSLTKIGLLPLSEIAAFITVPPFSLQYGGVSDQPPPKLTLTGKLATTSLCAILSSGLYLIPDTEFAIMLF